MSRVAVRTAQKTMDRCPHCGDRRPKELVAGEPRTNWFMFVCLICGTFGLGLLFTPLWRHTPLEAYCEGCETSFPV